MDSSSDTVPDTVKSVVQYTHRIWEDKAIGLIYNRYQHNVNVHTSFGDRYGRDEMVAAAVQELAALPDCRFHGDEVVWDDQHGLYVSHRATRVAHNTGYSTFGGPTGRRVRYRTITDCLIHRDRVVEVWEVHDGLTLARQLGFSVREAVAASARQHPDPVHQGYGELERLRGQAPPDTSPRPTTTDSVESFVRWTWHEVWNRRRLDRISQLYAPNYLFFGPSGCRLRTRHDYATYVLSLLAAFPDAVVQIDRLTSVGDSEDGYIAVRWRLSGTHDGPGSYGIPTGRRVNILGITHQRLRGQQFVEEWTVFDELALLVQLHASDDLEVQHA